MIPSSIGSAEASYLIPPSLVGSTLLSTLKNGEDVGALSGIHAERPLILASWSPSIKIKSFAATPEPPSIAVKASTVNRPESLSTAFTVTLPDFSEPPPSAVENFSSCPTSKFVTSSGCLSCKLVPVTDALH